ncbi:MAG: cupin domain-containing protein [Solirubrobacteraceae bacterium]
MEHWDLSTLDVEPRKPQILHSKRGEARSITLFLPAGEELQDHQVHERAHVVVVDGEIEIEVDGGETVTGGPGLLAVFDPNERHEVRARSDARLLLVLAPWPGPGHPGARD